MSKTNQTTGLLGEVYSELDPVFGFFSDYPIAVFLIVLCKAVIVAKIVTGIMTTVIVQITSRTKIKWDDEVINLLSRPVFWTLFLLGVLVAFIPLKLSKSKEMPSIRANEN